MSYNNETSYIDSLILWWDAFDADEVFTYQTQKIVNIKDKFLGISSYIIGFVILYSGGYLLKEVPIGALYTSIKRPDNANVNLKNLSYCLQNADHSSISPLDCRIDDEFDVNYPPDQTKAMFVTTREVYTLQSPACDDVTCKTPWNTFEETSYYPAAVENFTILGFLLLFTFCNLVKHSFVARKFYEETGDSSFALSNELMIGYFYNYQGLLIGKIPKGVPDIFTLKYILNACGIYFEDQSSISSNTVRFEGAVIVITITYENSDPINPTYSYHISAIPNTAYKFVEAKYYGSIRALSNRHGLKLIYVQTGEIGLLAVASLVIDMIMLQFMPMRRWYQKFKFFETKDLGDMSNDIRNGIDYRIMSDDNYNEMILLDQERLRNNSDDFHHLDPFGDKNDCIFSLTVPQFEIDDTGIDLRKKLKSNAYY